MAETEWIPYDQRKPERGSAVDWIAPDGRVVIGGRYHGGVVWFPPNSEMYIYYTPTFWRYSQTEDTPNG